MDELKRETKGPFSAPIFFKKEIIPLKGVIGSAPDTMSAFVLPRGSAGEGAAAAAAPSGGGEARGEEREHGDAARTALPSHRDATPTATRLGRAWTRERF